MAELAKKTRWLVARDPCRLEETDVYELDSSIMREVNVIRTYRPLDTVQGSFMHTRVGHAWLYILLDRC